MQVLLVIIVAILVVVFLPALLPVALIGVVVFMLGWALNWWGSAARSLVVAGGTGGDLRKRFRQLGDPAGLTRNAIIEALGAPRNSFSIDDVGISVWWIPPAAHRALSIYTTTPYVLGLMFDDDLCIGVAGEAANGDDLRRPFPKFDPLAWAIHQRELLVGELKAARADAERDSLAAQKAEARRIAESRKDQ